MEFLLLLATAIANSQEYGTPVQMEVDYLVTCEPLLDDANWNAHDDCVSQLIDAYYPPESLDTLLT